MIVAYSCTSMLAYPGLLGEKRRDITPSSISELTTGILSQDAAS
jgi:hypothetical protein